MRNRFLFLAAMLVLATINVASAADPKQVVLRIEDGQLAMTSPDGSVARCEQVTLTLGKTPIQFKVVDGMIEINVDVVTFRGAEVHFPAKNQRAMPATRRAA